MVTDQDIKRIEGKLDAIIQFFHIEASDPDDEVRDEIKRKVIRFQENRKKVYNKET